MSNEKLDALAKNTINEIKTPLIALQKKNASREAVCTVTTNCISKAFQIVHSEDERKYLYKKLTITLHPDIIKQNFGPELTDYLTNKNLKDDLQKIVYEFRDKSPISEISRSPTDWGSQLLMQFQLVMAYYNLKKQDKRYVESPHFKKELDEQWQEQIDAGWNKLYGLIPGLTLIISMNKQLDRYFQPLKFLFKTAYWLINIAVFVSIGASLIATAIPAITTGLIRLLLKPFINLCTSNAYHNIIKEHNEVSFPKAKSDYLQSLKEAEGEKALKLSDEDYIQVMKNFIIEQNAQGNPAYAHLTEDNFEEIQLNEAVRNKLAASTAGIKNLGFILKAIFYSFVRPLPNGVLNIIGSILVRPIQLLLSIPLLLFSTLNEAIHVTVNQLFLAVVFAAIGVKITTAFVFNLPLYIIDGVAFVINSFVDNVSGLFGNMSNLEKEPLKDATDGPTTQASAEQSSPTPSTYRRLLELEPEDLNGENSAKVNLTSDKYSVSVPDAYSNLLYSSPLKPAAGTTTADGIANLEKGSQPPLAETDTRSNLFAPD